MAISSNNEVIKRLLLENARENNYLNPFEYELLLSHCDDSEIVYFTIEYLCPHCDNLHEQEIVGVDLGNHKFIICSHLDFVKIPFSLLGFVATHFRHRVILSVLLNEIFNDIIPNIDAQYLVPVSTNNTNNNNFNTVVFSLN